jgi:hypothetical protein
MNFKTYIFYFTIIYFILILFSYLNKDLYNHFAFLIFVYALTNLYIKKCSLDSVF